MNAMKGRLAPSKNELLTIMEYNGANIAFEEINGKMMVNATQMAKPFGKQPVQWLRYEQSKDLIETVAEVRNHSLADLKVVRRGGNNPGTWFQEDIALFFAQWLSPKFYLACNLKLKEIVSTQSTKLLPKYGISPILHEGELLYPYSIACKKLGKIKYPRSGKRKELFPHHFKMVYGRNFITEAFLDWLKGHYQFANITNQLKLEL